MAYTLGPQTQDVTFLKTSFNGQTNFTVVWYLASNNSLPSNNRFISKAMQSQSIVYQKRMCNVFALTFYSGKQKQLHEAKVAEC
jgi:hypothetical protein